MEGLRFQLNNAAYSYSDAYILYSMIRKYEPKRIIEIGSGFSSALMLDMKDIYANDIELSFVEPFPIQLNKLISDTDKSNAKIIQKKVQDVDISVFKALQKNDILFIDSSHVSKTGSDVNYEFFDIIPNLNSGVIIHVHDIFYPFEYPKHWVYEGRNWTENYILRAFLSFNKNYEMLFFSDFIHKFYPEKFDNLPLMKINTGGNFWMVKK